MTRYRIVTNGTTFRVERRYLLCRWRARCFVIEKRFCRGFYLYRHGTTKEAAEVELRESTKDYWHAALDKIEFREYA